MSEKEYGLIDEESKWLGDDKGPHVYRDTVINNVPMTGQELARFAAAVLSKRLNKTIEAREYGCPNPVKIDEVGAIMTAEQAISELERGIL